MAEQGSVQARLFALQDEGYRAFQCKLMPTVPADTVIGVRMPALRHLAGELADTPQAGEFLARLPHTYYEENNLHGCLICRIKDYGEAVAALEAFLPFVDNWTTCDMLRPKAFDKRPAQLPGQLRAWIKDSHLYTVRFAMEMLMTYYLDEAFLPEYPRWVAGAAMGDYYVNMMAAWYFATALAKQYQAILPYLQENRLPVWVHNKTIQKAVESYRISPEQKAYLRTLRRK